MNEHGNMVACLLYRITRVYNKKENVSQKLKWLNVIKRKND